MKRVSELFLDVTCVLLVGKASVYISTPKSYKEKGSICWTVKQIIWKDS